MRVIVALCFALAAYAAPPAFAQDLTADDAYDITTACLAARHFEQGTDTCIGEVTRVCHERYGEAAATTQGLITCSLLEAGAWRRVINAHAETLRASQSATQTALLERALASGDQWTRDRCAYDASQYEGGSLERVVAAHCMRDTLGLRAVDLDIRVRPDDEG